MKKHSGQLRLIYILGGGHSGSTILSLMLGSAPEVFAMGELKFFNEHRNEELARWKYIENMCMCGNHALECPFWCNVDAQLAGEPQIFHYTSIMEKLLALFNILSPWHRSGRPSRDTATDDAALMQAVFSESRQGNPQTLYLLDSSKSLTRLMHLHTHPDIDLRVVFLVRDGRGYIHSYRKRHGGGFSRWLVQWIIVNTLSLLYVRKTGLPYYHLSYSSLCNRTAEHQRQMNEFLGITIPENFLSELAARQFHIRAANPNRLRKIKELREDTEWRTALRPIYRWIATLALFPFMRLLHDGR